MFCGQGFASEDLNCSRARQPPDPLQFEADRLSQHRWWEIILAAAAIVLKAIVAPNFG